MDSLGSGMLVLNPAGRVSVMNKTAGDMLEVDEDACTTSGVLRNDVFEKHQALRNPGGQSHGIVQNRNGRHRPDALCRPSARLRR